MLIISIVAFIVCGIASIIILEDTSRPCYKTGWDIVGIVLFLVTIILLIISVILAMPYVKQMILDIRAFIEKVDRLTN